MSTYIIQNINEPNLFWSNVYGWTETEFDIFSEYERETLSVPIDGKWLYLRPAN